MATLRGDWVKRSFNGGLSAVFLLLPALALAHHGSVSSYNVAKLVTAEGKVTEFRWRNPHVWIFFDVRDAKGNVVNWGAETHSPATCRDQDGWSKSTLQPGDRITISIFPANNGTPRGLLARIVFKGRVILDDVPRDRPGAR